MSVNPEGLLGNIKTANVFQHSLKAKSLNFNTYIYILNKKRNATVGHRGFSSLRVKR